LTAKSAGAPWIICPAPNPHARLRLFCLPYAGGGAAAFRRWPNHLPAQIELCAIQPPGRENRLREVPICQLSPLVVVVAGVLEPYLDLPCAFFGHSVGSLVAFELARQLRKLHRPAPAHLFVSGRRAPQIPDRDPPMHQLADDDFIRELDRRFDGVPEAVRQEAELMSLLRPMLRADIALDETYVYADGEPLDSPISAFGGLQDRKVSHDDLAAWRDQTRGAFTHRMLPGNHFFLQSAQEMLLQAISQDLKPFLH
jgi:medium-chain acyl-[acyl-carrier-protein] hydrolase